MGISKAAVTIDDVARLAGVSRQTVSRVINNAQGVKSDTRLRVLQAVEKLDYYPNIAARRLASNSVANIGLLIPFSHEQIASNPFFAQVISAICNTCSNRELGLQVYSRRNTEEYPLLFSRLYREKHVGGLIISCPEVSPRQIMQLRVLEIPVVFVGRPALTAEVSYVDHNIEQMAFIATSHLAEQGYDSIAMVNGPRFMTFSQDQSDGYRSALMQHGLNWLPEWELASDFTEKSGYAAVKELMSLPKRPTAIYLVNDTLTIGALEALREGGWRTPEDVALVAGEDRRWDGYARQGISAFQMDVQRIGATAVRMLLEQMDGKAAAGKVEIIEAKFMVRASTERFNRQDA